MSRMVERADLVSLESENGNVLDPQLAGRSEPAQQPADCGCLSVAEMPVKCGKHALGIVMDVTDTNLSRTIRRIRNTFVVDDEVRTVTSASGLCIDFDLVTGYESRSISSTEELVMADLEASGIVIGDRTGRLE